MQLLRLAAERDLPESTTGRRIASPTLRYILVLLRVGFTQPLLLPEERWSLTPPFHPYPEFSPGGFFSVALALGSPPPDVIRHSAL